MISRVFIGHDSTQKTVSEVCEYSIRRRTTREIDIQFLKQSELIDAGIYWREPDPLASTEFTYLRFLVPYLCNFEGIALFCDNDFLWLDDIEKLFDEYDESYALQCVQHDYRPTETAKMDGKKQTVYPRKNWSSLMLFNCAHPANRALSLETVNSETGSFLHQMQWLEDEQIGKLPVRWNWLEGWYSSQPDYPLGAVHYTRGGPWYDEWKDCDFAQIWLDERASWIEERDAAGE